jgi:hypothetical protein
MTVLVLANINLTMLCLLIGLIVGLSRLGGGNPNDSITGL